MNAKTAKALAAIAARPWLFTTFGEFGLSYQTCRFCKRGQGDTQGLWKYGVRHYACEDCRKAASDKGKAH